MEDLTPCAYCGLVADTTDHVPPVSIRPVLIQMGLHKRYPFFTVPACKECNSTLNDRAHWTFATRRRYLYKRYQRRYKRALQMPDWSAVELGDMSRSLRDHIEHGLAVRDVTRERLKRLQEPSTRPLERSSK